ncbi:sensor histidine kinase [Horticoccus sp. 23ND18S-11]|uniref:sensor histidine kinase n=1 Tax=Horticoccus sp. 23ND18S-11 TaxID=3391832 RepID=UPI0039C96170
MPLLRLLLLTGFAPLALQADPLVSFTAVRALPHDEAEKGLEVKLDATVLGADPASPWNVFMHDGTAGCYVKLVPGKEPAHFPPGTRLRVEGSSMLLGYYPSVGAARATVLMRGPLPLPARLSADQIFSPEFDSAWVEVPAVVVGYEARDRRLTLDIEVYGLPFKAELPVEARADERAAALMQRQVLLRGVLGTIFNRQRQMTDRHFFVSSFDAIEPVDVVAAGGAAPLIAVAQVLTGGYGPKSPVRLQGVVTQSDPKGFYLRDVSGSTLVYAARGSRFAPGTRVEVEGYGSVAPFRPLLRAARVEAMGLSAPPEPMPFDFKGSDLPRLQAELVTLEATLLAIQESRSDLVLECQTGQQIFEVLIPVGGAAPMKVTVGDRLRLTGICELTTTHALPRMSWVDGFRLHLPGPAGVAVLARAPWWNTSRLLIALGGMSAMAMLGWAGTWVLRRQVGRQMEIIGDQLRAEAVGKERDRIARDLHDTLEQQLSGVALQLDGLDAVVKSDPAAARQALLLARRMLRHTRLEARRSVMNLRSEILEKQGLSAGLQDMAETSASPTGPRIEVRVCGEERALPAVLEFHLFRIAQEALANAIKHADAREIVIEVEHASEASYLRVRDDGRGFDLQSKEATPGPHFGLLGMRERAAHNGAELRIATAPGTGCLVTVDVPKATFARPS